MAQLWLSYLGCLVLFSLSWTTQEGLLDRLQPWNGICVMISFLHSNEALLFIWCFYFSSSVPARERKKGKKRYFIINNSNSFNLIQFHVFVRFMEMAIEHIWDGYWISRYVDVESSLNKRVIITWRWELQLAWTFSLHFFSLRSGESHLLADFSRVEAAAQRKKLVEVASHLVFINIMMIISLIWSIFFILNWINIITREKKKTFHFLFVPLALCCLLIMKKQLSITKSSPAHSRRRDFESFACFITIFGWLERIYVMIFWMMMEKSWKFLSQTRERLVARDPGTAWLVWSMIKT